MLIIYRFFPRRIRTNKYLKKWRHIQSLCKNKDTWPQAIEESELLLKKAITCQKFKGKSMGEKLTNGQRYFTDNDSLWVSYKIYKKVKETNVVLREIDVRKALYGFRQALKDVGALPKDETK
jgi:hypothetical protein